jgi:EAL domain-containing protein (putative c-di-GMP-specific phosphodiesterase class I)/CheY-like chemotaxis protein
VHDGVFTRRVLSNYLERAGYEVAESAGVALAVGSPEGIRSLVSRPETTICIGAYGDPEPQDLMRRGMAQAVLTQPVRRHELVQMLFRLRAREPLYDAADQGPERSAKRLPSFAGSRVLVADDSAVNREVALEALQRLDIEATLVDDGRAAIDAALRQRFDAILMDGSMPGMSGYEAALEIRRREETAGGNRVPIIALTAHVVGAVADAWRDSGMDAVLHKPFTLNALADTLGGFLTASTGPAVSAVKPVAAAELSISEALQTVRRRIDLFDPEVVAQLEEFAAGGKSDFVARVFRLYRENAPGCIATLRDSLRLASTDNVAAAAHSLKSMSYNIGAKAVAATASEIEALALDGTIPEVTLIERIATYLDDTLEALGFSAAPAAENADPDELALLRDLQEALSGDGLFVVYQPQFNASGDTPVACETLVRWNHPRLGPISPAVFVPLAEKHSLIGQITDFVLHRAMVETKEINLPIAINASAHDFANANFVPRVRKALAATGFDANRLEIEVTETAILANQEQVRRNMEELHHAGVTIALDDFGAGHANLQHVRRFPFDRLKIDRELITDCSRDVQAATLVHAVVSVGRALGMQVTAEGVETEHDWQFLRIGGVHTMQGWLFSKPISCAELQAMAQQKSPYSPARAA